MNEAAFHAAILAHPDDWAVRLVYADWLEEHGDPRGEMVRLLHSLHQPNRLKGRANREERLRQLLESGVRPPGPFWTNSSSMTFACIPPGTFRMGSGARERGRDHHETRHTVTLTHGFFLSIHPVTQEQWTAVMKNNPSRFEGPTHPVEMVTWNDCKNFCRELSRAHGCKYRLPTEAEWEYACRAGTSTAFHFGPTLPYERANYDGRLYGYYGSTNLGRDSTTPVDAFPVPNAWGLWNMHGNVFDWVADRFEDLPSEPQVDPKGPTTGNRRIVKGGCFGSGPIPCRSAFRMGRSVTETYEGWGFRLALTRLPGHPANK